VGPVNRTRVAIALALAATVAAALIVYEFATNTFTPRIEAYDIADDHRRLTVFVCGQTNDTIVDQRVLRADSTSVTVQVRLRRDTNPSLFHHGTSFEATVTLASTLGDRIVRDGLGNIVGTGPHLCPG
jgi:hypothetical protein